MSLNSDTIPIQKRISEILYNVQILYKNQCITVEEKNRIAALLNTARKTKDMSELNQLFRRLQYGAIFPSVVEELISLTSP
jgi:hypothetical protein